MYVWTWFTLIKTICQNCEATSHFNINLWYKYFVLLFLFVTFFGWQAGNGKCGYIYIITVQWVHVYAYLYAYNIHILQLFDIKCGQHWKLYNFSSIYKREDNTNWKFVYIVHTVSTWFTLRNYLSILRGSKSF